MVRCRINREQVTTFFNSYVAAYDADNPKRRLKIEHTYKVAEMAERIAGSIDADTDLAWLSGMLHDIGRFEQLKRYNTFVDAVSLDHALLSSRLLFEEGLIEQVAPELDYEERHILECAIRNHSLYRLPEGLAEVELTYCNILRDADKLDIFRAICETPLEELYSFTREELDASEVSEEVKACYNNRTAVLKCMWKTPADRYVAHICLVFELVYPASRKLAKEQGYVDQLLHDVPKNPDTAMWYQYMRETVWQSRE